MSKHWHPSPLLSQNFIRHAALAERLVALPDFTSVRTILEIGPGFGAITTALLARLPASSRLTAIEIDPFLYSQLRQKISDPRLTLVNADILPLLANWQHIPHILCANLPFRHTSAILSSELNIHSTGCREVSVIIQKEAAIMFGGAKTGALTKKSLLIAPFFDCGITHHCKPSDFAPAPRVQTVVFAAHRRPSPLIPQAHSQDWASFTALCAQDRVGEGAWKSVFQKKLTSLKKNRPLIWHRGLASQSAETLIQVFLLDVVSDATVLQRLRRIVTT